MYTYIYSIYYTESRLVSLAKPPLPPRLSIILYKFLYFISLLQKQQNDNITYCTVRIHHSSPTCVPENATVVTASPARPVYADAEKKLKKSNTMYKLYVHNNAAT